MQAHTNAPPIDPVLLTFAVPPDMVETIMQTMHRYGLREENESVPWREALPFKEEEWPQIALRGGRTKEGLTQKQLSELTGIPRTHISDMERGRRPIGKQTARKLAEALKVDARLFLSV